MSNILQGKFSSKSTISEESKAKAESLLKLLLESDISDHSGAYPMAQVHTTVSELESVPDIAKGGSARNRRWGAMISVAVIPGLDDVPVGPITLPATPFSFYDADSLDEMKARLIHEIDKAIETAKLSNEDPDAFRYVQEEFQNRLQGIAQSVAGRAK